MEQVKNKIPDNMPVVMHNIKKWITDMLLNGKPAVELAVSSAAFRFLCLCSYRQDVKDGILQRLELSPQNLKQEAWDMAVYEADGKLSKRHCVDLAMVMYWMNDFIAYYVTDNESQPQINDTCQKQLYIS